MRALLLSTLLALQPCVQVTPIHELKEKKKKMIPHLFMKKSISNIYLRWHYQAKTKDGVSGNGTAFKKCGGSLFGGSERWPRWLGFNVLPVQVLRGDAGQATGADWGPRNQRWREGEGTVHWWYRGNDGAPTKPDPASHSNRAPSHQSTLTRKLHNSHWIES